MVVLSMRSRSGSTIIQIPNILFVFLLIILAGSCTLEKSDGELYLNALYSVIDLTAAQNPDIARVDIIGTAAGSGAYPIKRIIITGSDLEKCAVTEKPRVLITGATHGNEQISAEVAVRLADYLIEQYQAGDSQITTLLDACEVHIVPVLNPWGVVNSTRRTAEGVDINRDFGSPDPDTSVPLSNSDWFHPWYGGFAAKESRILRDLCERERYILSIQGHTGDENINLPMDYLGYLSVVEDEENPDYLNPDYLDTFIPIYPLMESFAIEYVESVNIDGFYYTEGFDWYLVTGSITDWHFGALGAPGYTIEYDNQKGEPSEEKAEIVWQEHKTALIELLEITSHRISGKITTGSDNDPVSALITVQRTIVDNSRAFGDPTPITLTVRSDPYTGYYHILIPDGDWDMTVTALGYINYTETVNKSGDAPLLQNIQLSPTAKY